MRKTTKSQHFVARYLSGTETEKLLIEIGTLFKTMREERCTLEQFAYETEICTSQIRKYQKGGDLLLSSFLRVLHGLGVSGEEFFKKLTAFESTGSSNRITRAIILEQPPSLDAGEVTDKGTINQKAVLRNRRKLVDELYGS